MINIFKWFKRSQPEPCRDTKTTEKQLKPFRRNAWFPRVAFRSAARDASKFSGTPALAEEEAWPLCRHCRQPMQLFIQLNSAHLPQEAGQPFGDGFLQVFYCTNKETSCETECEAFFPFSQSTLVRVLDFTRAQTQGSIDNPVNGAFPEKAITGWEVQADYPNGEELDELGCSLSDEQFECLSEMGYPLPKDKLLGWPFWVQGVEYPECPDCGKRMNLIFQIDSEDNLPYMFGDVGCAHITQCATHKDRMAIAWACH
jgi:hypothetical protein